MTLMNPKDETEKDEEEDVRRMQTDVTDEEMARRWESAMNPVNERTGDEGNESLVISGAWYFLM